MKSENDVKAGLKIFKMILFLILYLHIFSCYYWSIISDSGIWVPPEFIHRPARHDDLY